MFALTLAALTVAEVAGQGIAARVAAHDSATGLCRFVGYPGEASKDVFTLNPQFWLKGVDFSCVSPWNSGGGRLRAGTAISKRHIVFANHFPLWKGVRIVFVGEDGGVCPCYVEGTRRIADTDIMIASLNAELTPNIRPAMILPPDYERHIGDGKGLPVVLFGQNETAALSELVAVPSNRLINIAGKTVTPLRPSKPFWTQWYVRTTLPTNAPYAAFGECVKSGDSGNPAFLLINDNPVLLCCISGSCGGCSGPPLHLYRSEIQKAMDELCPGYKLADFDFSSIRKYEK